MSEAEKEAATGIETAKVEYAFRRTPASEKDLLSRETTTERYDTSVRVLQLPMSFAVEFGLSPEGSTDYNYKRCTPEQARTLATQLRQRPQSELYQNLGDLLASVTADGLKEAANLANTEALREMMGEDVIDAYQDGTITAEEAAHEGERNIDRQFDDQVR